MALFSADISPETTPAWLPEPGLLPATPALAPLYGLHEAWDGGADALGFMPDAEAEPRL